jgi:hypothetical protein
MSMSWRPASSAAAPRSRPLQTEPQIYVSAWFETRYGAATPSRPALIRIVKRKLKKIRYQPHLIDGRLAATGLTI